MAASLSRWHRIFAAALEKRAAVGFQVVLQEHLGRIASHSETIAARRAAHSFAAAGHGRLEHVLVAGHGNRDRLVLVRADADVSADLLAAALVPAGDTPVVRDSRAMHTEATRRLVDTVKEFAAQSRHIEASELNPVDGAVLGAALGAALTDLAKLRRRLARLDRTRSAAPATLRSSPDGRTAHRAAVGDRRRQAGT